MEHIQDVAFGLFEEKGYREVTITEITHAAEVAPSTFYRLFQTKEGLFTALPTEDHLDLGTVRRSHLAEDILTLIAGNEWRGLKWVIEEPDVRCAVLATLVTLPIWRLGGHYVSMATLALGYIVLSVIRGWDAVTKGAYGLSGIPAPEILGLRLLVAEDHYQLDLVVLAVTLFVVFRIRSSHLGNVLAAVGSDEIASLSLGLRTRGYKALAYALAAFFAGMAGALLAHQYNYLDPTVFTVQMSVLVLTIVVLGGINSPFGAVLGSLALVGLPEALRLAPDVRILLYGIVVIAIIRFLPQGLWTRSA